MWKNLKIHEESAGNYPTTTSTESATTGTAPKTSSITPYRANRDEQLVVDCLKKRDWMCSSSKQKREVNLMTVMSKNHLSGEPQNHLEIAFLIDLSCRRSKFFFHIIEKKTNLPELDWKLDLPSSRWIFSQSRKILISNFFNNTKNSFYFSGLSLSTLSFPVCDAGPRAQGISFQDLEKKTWKLSWKLTWKCERRTKMITEYPNPHDNICYENLIFT